MWKKNRIEKLARWSVIFLFFGFVLWASLTSPSDIVLPNYSYITLDDWVQIVEGETFAVGSSMEGLQEVDVGETILIETILPDITKDDILYFYSENQEIRVWVGDECIYSFLMQEGYEILETPGSKWNTVELTEEMSGERLRIEYTCNFGYYQLELHPCLIMNKGIAWLSKFQSSGAYIIVGLLLLILAIISYINGMIWKRDQLSGFLTNMGDLYLCVSLWILAECNFYDYIFHRPILSYVSSMILIRVLLIVFCSYVQRGLPRNYRIMKILESVVWGNLFGTCILQMCFGISFVELLTFNNSIIIIGGIIIIALYIDSIVKWDKTFHMEDIFVFNAIFVIGAIVDIYLYYQNPDYAMIMGGATMGAMIVYAMIIHLVLLNHETNTDLEKINLEVSYKKLQSTALMHQIKVHFIFNTLNTISALCKQDAHKADEAIKLFSRYLRSYMYLINMSDNIPFENELELVESYLEIEKMRFGDELSYQINLEYCDFVLPPLTIQPLVENCMNHGLRKNGNVGEIRITSIREEENIKIMVEDNGVGFDIRELEKSDSIGIRNLTQRMEYMVNGIVEYDSRIGEGTTVTITIPV